MNSVVDHTIDQAAYIYVPGNAYDYGVHRYANPSRFSTVSPGGFAPSRHLPQTTNVMHERTTPVRLIGIWAPAPQSGKTTASGAISKAHRWVDPDKGGVEQIAFADSMRRIIRSILGEYDIPFPDIHAYMTLGDLKEKPIPGVGKSFVELAMKVGNDLGRGWLGESVWVDAWVRRAERALLIEKTIVVCDDVRFANEAAAIRELGGVMLGVSRPGATVSAQRAAAEGKVSRSDMDGFVENDGSKAAFERRVVNEARRLGLPL